MPGISVPRIAIPFKGKGGINYAAYWATLISATVEQAAPANVVLTFPSEGTSVATDITATVNGVARTVNSASWTGAVWTVVLASAVDYGDVVAITFKESNTSAVTNNVTNIRFTLTAQGTGLGINTLILKTSEDILLTLTGGAKFYSNSAGTLDESTTWTAAGSGVNRTIYIRCSEGTSYLIIEKNKITNWVTWNGGSSEANASSISGPIHYLSLLTLQIDGPNTFDININDLQEGLTSIFLRNGTLSGTSFPSTLTSLTTDNVTLTLSSIISSLPAGIKTLDTRKCKNAIDVSIFSGLPPGLNTLKHESSTSSANIDIGTFPSLPTSLITFSYANTQLNAIINIDSLPSNLTYFSFGGNYENFASGYVSGDLDNLPAGITYFYSGGRNQLTYTSGHTWSNSLNYIRIRSIGLGLSSTIVDNLIIDTSSATWAGSSRTLKLDEGNYARTADSDAAAATLAGKSVTLTTFTPAVDSFDNGKVIFSFDDGYSSIIDLVHPLFTTKGITGTFFIVTDWVGESGRATWANLQTMDAAGHEIASHGKTHTLFTSLTVPQLTAELDAVDAAFVANSLPEPTTVAYPYGQNNDTVRSTCALYYSMGRTVGVSLFLPSTNEFSIPIFTSDGVTDDTLWYILDMIATAHQSQKGLMFMIHNVVETSPAPAGSTNISILEDIIDFCQTIGIDIVNLESMPALMT